MNPFSLFSRISLLAVALLTMSASSVSAAVIEISSLSTGDGGATDYLITSTSGNLLASGYAGAGLFNLSESQVRNLAAAGNYAGLFAAFQPIGESDNFINGGIMVAGEPVPGYYGTREVSFPITPAILGRSIYTLLSDNGDPSEVTSFALFESKVSLAPDPTAPPIPNDYFITPATSTILVGTVGPKVYSSVAQTAFNAIQLVAVPEPSSFAVAITGLALASLRRRR